MGGNYYCEYCDKTFRDVLGIRKTHIKGAQHRQMKKEHFDKYRDLKTLLAEEGAREPCPRLLKNLECSFGTRCRFTHYMPWELKAMQHEQQQGQADQSTQIQLNLLISRLEEKYDPDLRTQSLLPPSMRKWTSTSFVSQSPEWHKEQ